MNQNYNPPADAGMPKPAMLDVETIRRDFPLLQRQVHGKPLVWLDNAATTQKPQAVIDRVVALLRARELQHPSRHPHAGDGSLRRL